MKKVPVLLACVIAAVALVAVGPAAGKPRASKGVSGGFNLGVHTHSANDPVFPGLLFPTDRLSYGFVEGEDFSYSSRTCAGSAPFNEVGLDFRPDYPGVDDDQGTAAVRHRVAGTITKVNGDKGTLQGTITSVLCVTENGVRTESVDVIITDFRAKYRRVSDNRVQVTGRFRISPTRSTGTFEDLKGHGSLKGVFTCLTHDRDPAAPTCAQRGHFTDFVGLRGDLSKPPGETVPGLKGTYRDPTVGSR